MVEFLDIWIKNFMPFGKTVHIRLDNQGVIRIEGRNLDEIGEDSNGSGKSAIIEALVWVLFGKTIRGLKHDEVVNRFAKKDCSVSIRFSLRGQTYIVRRYRKHKRHSNKLYLWNGDRLVSFRHEEDTQQRICNLLGGSFNSFTNSVLFGGLRPFASLSDADQKKVLESMLHFEEFDKALKATKRILGERTEEAQTNLLRIEKRRGEANTLHEKLKTLKEGEQLFLQELQRRYRDALHKARHLQKDIQSHKRIPQDDIKEKEKSLRKKQKALSDTLAKVSLYERQLKKIRDSISDRASLVGKPCPTCGTKVSGDTVASYLEHLLGEKKHLKKRLIRCKAKLDLLEEEVNLGSTVLKDLETKYNVLRIRNAEYNEAEEEVVRCKKQLAISSSSNSPLETEIARASIKFSKALSRQLIAIQKGEAIERSIADLKFWERGFGNGGIKALVIKEALPALNMKLSEYANEIFGGRAELKFLPTKTTKSGNERELFHVQYSAKRGSGSYRGESTGRKRRIDISILLCFSWLSRTCNLLLCDELLDGLDESGRECVLRILAAQRQTCFVISHRRDVKSQIGKVWMVTKKDGYSRVEVN